jgi:hypothetical protein
MVFALEAMAPGYLVGLEQVSLVGLGQLYGQSWQLLICKVLSGTGSEMRGELDN